MLSAPSGVHQHSDRCDRHQADVIRGKAFYVWIRLQNLRSNRRATEISDSIEQRHTFVRLASLLRAAACSPTCFTPLPSFERKTVFAN